MVTSTYIKVNFSSIEDGFVYYSDIAPNLPLEVFISVPENGFVGEPVAFNATVIPFTGMPPYSYLWEFGDGDTSTGLRPIHVYMEAGVYTYTFTATDSLGETANASGTIAINAVGDGQNPVVFQQSNSRFTSKQLLRFHPVMTRLVPFFL
jgi:PKD repeat protein